MNFTEKKKLPKEVILVSMHVTSLYIKISQVEGRNIVCAALEAFTEMLPPFQSPSQRKHRRNSFQFNEQRYLQTYRNAVVTKKAAAFAKIFMAKFETHIVTIGFRSLNWTFAGNVQTGGN